MNPKIKTNRSVKESFFIAMLFYKIKTIIDCLCWRKPPALSPNIEKNQLFNQLQTISTPRSSYAAPNLH
jgi:hypothetical protein